MGVFELNSRRRHGPFSAHDESSLVIGADVRAVETDRDEKGNDPAQLTAPRAALEDVSSRVEAGTRAGSS
jgi:hypothetical protein